MFFDTDAGGVMHNLAYLRMIETCRTHLATEWLNSSMANLGEKKLFLALTQSQIRYLRPAKLSEKLDILGGITSYSSIRIHCNFTIERNQEILCTCKQELALIQLPEGKPTKLSFAKNLNS